MPSTERATAGSSAVERKRQAIADSMQAQNSRRMSGLLTMWQWLCYGAYIVSGLQLLANPLFGTFVSEKPWASWHVSVYIWAFGNLAHGVLTYGNWFVVQTLVSCAVVGALEEVGLQTGLVFGNYYFTDTLGHRITSNLPTIVIGLWLCLLYPSATLTNAIVNGHPAKLARTKGQKAPFLLAIVAASITVSFDLFSEIVGVTLGHRLWTFSGFERPDDCNAYTQQPDWVFPDASIASLDFGSVPLFDDKIPIHNFVGWFVTGLIVHFVFYALRTKFEQAQRSRFYVRPSPIVAWLPIASILCTAAFYLLHPCHPPIVRAISGSYLAIIFAALAWRGHPSHVRKVGSGKLPHK